MSLPLSPYALSGGPDVIGVPAYLNQYLAKRGAQTAFTGIRPFALGVPVLADPLFDSRITIDDQAWAGVVLWQGGDYLVLQVTDLLVWSMGGNNVPVGTLSCNVVSAGGIHTQAYGTVIPHGSSLDPSSVTTTLPIQLDCGDGSATDACALTTSEAYDVPGLYIAAMCNAPRRHQRNSVRPYYACGLATGYPASPTNPVDIARGVGAALSAAHLPPAGAHSSFFYAPGVAASATQFFKQGS